MTKSESRHARRSQALEALGAFQKLGGLPSDREGLGEILNGESDRGLIVILGSWLEDHLLDRLLELFATLTTVQRKDLVRPGGLLSTFADKIALASALAMIDQQTADELRVFQAMRNACAHSRQHMNLATQELKDVMSLLFADEPEDGMVELVRDGTPRILRILLVAETVYLFAVIRGESRSTAMEHGQQILDAVLAEVTRQA